MALTPIDVAVVAVLALSVACMVVAFVKRGRCPAWLVVLGLVPPLSAAALTVWIAQNYDGEAWMLALATWALLAAALLLLSLVKAGTLRRWFVTVGLAMCGIPAIPVLLIWSAILLDPPSMN